MPEVNCKGCGKKGLIPTLFCPCCGLKNEDPPAAGGPPALTPATITDIKAMECDKGHPGAMARLGLKEHSGKTIGFCPFCGTDLRALLSRN